MIQKTRLSKEYWDSLQSKADLYEAFEEMDQIEVAACKGDPDDKIFYKDGEFKAVAAALKKAAEPLRPILEDILEHCTDVTEPRKNEAETLFSDFDITDEDHMAVIAWFINIALDSENEKSLVSRLEAGNGIPETMAARRAYARYQAFKAEDDAKLEAFKATPEYQMQAMELKLGLRDHIDLPEK